MNSTNKFSCYFVIVFVLVLNIAGRFLSQVLWKLIVIWIPCSLWFVEFLKTWIDSLVSSDILYAYSQAVFFYLRSQYYPWTITWKTFSSLLCAVIIRKGPFSIQSVVFSNSCLNFFDKDFLIEMVNIVVYIYLTFTPLHAFQWHWLMHLCIAI